MRDGAEIVYQAAFLDPDGWVGYADFLMRTGGPSDLVAFPTRATTPSSPSPRSPTSSPSRCEPFGSKRAALAEAALRSGTVPKEIRPEPLRTSARIALN
jgi:hypothetical protein